MGSRLHFGAAVGMTLSAILTAAPSFAQAVTQPSNPFPPGTDCSSLSEAAQTACRSYQQQSVEPVPAGNGTGTNPNGSLSATGQTNGSSWGAGAGNGGADGPGQPIPSQAGQGSRIHP